MHIVTRTKAMGRPQWVMTGKATSDHAGGVVLDVVTAVANTADTDPLSLNPPLGEAVDTGALERLAESSSVSRIAFEYHGHTVVIADDGTVSVDGQAGMATGMSGAYR